MSISHKQCTVKASWLPGWDAMPVLFASQGIAALTGLAYGKLVAVFVDADAFGTYAVQYAVFVLVYSAFIQPLIQSFTASLQRHELPAAAGLHATLFGGVYGCLLVAALLYAIGIGSAVGLLMWLAGLMQAVYLLATGFLNVSARHRDYAFLQAANPALNVALLIVLIGSGVRLSSAQLWINLVALNGVMAALALWKAPALRRTDTYRGWPVRLGSQRKMATEVAAFTGPLLLYAGFGWVNNYADRYLIQHVQASVVGVGFYVVGYSLGARIAVLASPIIAHLTPLIYAMRSQSRPARDTLPLVRQHLLLFWAMALPVCGILFAFQDEIGGLLLSEQYRASFGIAPVVALAYVCVLTVHLLDVRFYAYGQTRCVLTHTAVGAVANVLLNAWLIPDYGIRGAALATLLSFGSQLLVAVYLLLNRQPL